MALDDATFQNIVGSPSTRSAGVARTKLSPESFAQILGRPAPVQAQGFARDLELFAKSTLQSSLPDLLGIDPAPEIARFRSQHPIADFASAVLGSAPFFLAPYLVPLKALQAIPLAGRLAAVGGRLTAQGNPAFGRAAVEAARFLPFEAARVAIGTGIGIAEGKGPEKLVELSSAAAFDLAAIPLTALAFTKILRATPLPRGAESPTRKLQGKIELNTNNPLQQQLHDVVNLTVPEADKELTGLVASSIGSLKTLIRQETVPGPGQTFVRRLERAKDQPSTLNRFLFQEDIGKPRKTYTVQMPIQTQGPQGFVTAKARNEAIKELPELWEKHTQFMRVVTATDIRGAGRIQTILDSHLKKFGPNLQLAKESGDGGYVMAKKILGGKTLAEGDRWLLFKTNNPELFAPPGFSRSKNALLAHTFDPVEEASAATLRARTPMAKNVNDFNKFATSADIIGSPKDGRGMLIKAGQKALEKMPKEFQNNLRTINAELGAGISASGRFLKQFLAPSISQFSRSPRAQRTFGMAQTAFRLGEVSALKILHGGTKIAAGKNPLAEIVIPTRVLKRADGGLMAVPRTLSEAQRTELTQAFNQALSVEDAVEKGFDVDVVKLLTELQKHDDEFISHAQNLSALAGKRPPAARRSHYMMTRTWIGDWRLAMKDADGVLINMASGRDRRGVVEMAQKMFDTAKAEGKELSFDPKEIFRVGKFGDDLELVSSLKIDDPVFKATQEARGTFRGPKASRGKQFEKPRHGVGGFLGEQQTLTVKELEDQFTRQITGRQQFLATRALDADPVFQRELSLLAQEDSDLFLQLGQRMNDLRGVPGPIVTALEKVLDVPLEPFLGKGGAQKITRAANSAMFNLTLGMGDIGYPLLNGLTFMQTVLPEIAYTLRTPPARLLEVYTFQPMLGANGAAKGSMGILDMTKLMAKSFKEVRTMGDDAVLAGNMNRAILEGEVAPRFVEEFGGKTSKKALMFKNVLKGEESFGSFITSASQFLPALSEDLARGHAFTTGHIVARDFLKLEGENLYQFARQFTRRTMFGYSTADRPRVMAGALGGTLGLFKNWTAHYIANMARYGGEAVTRGNWAPLLWMMAGTGTVAGVGGMPLVGAVDAASRFFSDNSLMENTYEAFGMRDSTTVADAVWYGMPGLLGTSLQSRGAAPGSDVMRDIGFLFSAAIADRAVSFSKAMGGFVDQWEATGENPLKNDLVRMQFARALGPRTLYRALQASQDRAIVSAQSGNKLLGNVNLAEKLGFTLGITPLRIDKAFTAHRELWEDQKMMIETVQNLGAALNDAEDRKDWSMVSRIWNESGLLGITDRVLSSSKRRRANANEDLFERQFDEILAPAKLRLFGVR